MPLISVLLPVYNAERYVKAAVESVRAQTFGDFELIVIDDGSTDGSLSVLRSLEKQDKRIRLISRPNVGLVATLNEMLCMATGYLVARMDADDICRPTRFEKQVGFLSENQTCVAVGTRGLFIDSEGLPLFDFVNCWSHEEIEKALFRPELAIIHPSLMVRFDAIESVGGYRTGFPHAEDLDLFLRLGEIGRLSNLPEVLLEYRVHASSVSHSNAVMQSEAARHAVSEAMRRRGLQDVGVMAAPLVLRPETEYELHRKWAWWALSAGNRASARKHAAQALLKDPVSWASWHLMACTLRRQKNAI